MTGTAAIVTSAPFLLVRDDHVLVVHPVELIAGEDQHVLDARLLDVAEVLRTASAVP